MGARECHSLPALPTGLTGGLSQGRVAFLLFFLCGLHSIHSGCFPASQAGLAVLLALLRPPSTPASLGPPHHSMPCTCWRGSHCLQTLCRQPPRLPCSLPCPQHLARCLASRQGSRRPWVRNAARCEEEKPGPWQVCQDCA